MALPCAVLGDLLTAGAASALDSSPQSSVRVNGVLLAVVGSHVHDHGAGSHNNATMIAGSVTFRINGLAVVMTGAPASCSHTAIGTAPVEVTG